MKKTFLGVAAAGVVVVGAAAVIAGVVGHQGTPSEASSDASPLLKRMGEEWQKYDQREQEQIIARGRNIQISLEELQFRINVLKLDGRSSEWEKVLTELIEEKTLYHNAEAEGIVMEDEEAEAQVQQLKDMLEDEDAEGGEQVKEMIDSFEDEEAYWDYTKERIIIKGSIEKYKDMLREEYADGSDLSEEEVDDKLEEKIDSLIRQEKVEVDQELLKAL